jgi:hypothetical protein
MEVEVEVKANLDTMDQRTHGRGVIAYEGKNKNQIAKKIKISPLTLPHAIDMA